MLVELPAEHLDQPATDRQADTEAAIAAGHGAVYLAELMVEKSLIGSAEADTAVD